MQENSGLKTLHALISMMDEPDDVIYSSLKEKVLSYEEEAVPVLEEAWMAATDLLVVSRLEELMEEINFKLVFNRLKLWLEQGAGNLHMAMLAINKLGNKDFDEHKYSNLIELLFKDTWLEINDNLTALEKTKVLNHIFFKVHQFNGKAAQSHAVSDFFVANLLETKEGNPTSLGILYLSVAQYLKLPVFGVNLPGHLILAYTSDHNLLNKNEQYGRDDILFYINPYNEGAVFTENEIERYIKQVKLDNKEHYFLPAGNKAVIARYLKEIRLYYNHENDKQKADYIAILLGLF